MTTNSLTHLNINFNGASFLLDVAEGKLMSLNTIYAAVGSPANRDPRIWLRSVEAKKFIENLCLELDVKKTHIVRASRGGQGGGGGTWAHWKIAVRYAAYLAPSLDSAILDVFQERVQEEIDPGKAIDRGIDGYKRQGKSSSWIDQRVKTKIAWNALTDVLKEHEVTKYGYARCADSINVPIMGNTASAIKKENGLKKSDSIRDMQDEVTLALLNAAQVLSKDKISKSDVVGDQGCSRICFAVSKKVAALKDMV